MWIFSKDYELEKNRNFDKINEFNIISRVNGLAGSLKWPLVKFFLTFSISRVHLAQFFS